MSATETAKNGKSFKGPGGEHIMNSWQHFVSVRTPDGFVHKSNWQVADVRRTLVSASHIIQAGDDLIIGTNEACVENRKKDKSMLRKATCTCSIFFWRCSQASPRRSSTSLWKSMQSTKLPTGEKKGSESNLIKASQLLDGRRSEHGRQVQDNRNRKTTT